MCLDNLENFKTNGKGWKVFYKRGNYYSSPFFGGTYDLKVRYPCYRNKIRIRIVDEEEIYNSGFHLFIRKKDAMIYKKYLKQYKYFKDSKLVVKKVSYEEINATGTQVINGSKVKVAVADRMTIL